MKIPNRFEFIQTLGEGKFSTVVLAKIKDSEQLVAIKIIKKNGQNLPLFRSESRILKYIKTQEHCQPNLLCLIETDHDLENFYLITEYIPNVLTLSQWLKTHTDWNLYRHEKAEIIQNLIQAVKHLHSLQSSHRDLKPDNILVLPNNQIKLIDFGFGCHAEDCPRYGMAGTPAFIAPEALDQSQIHTIVDYQRHDLWALGCLIWLIIYGRLDRINLWLQEAKKISHDMKTLPLQQRLTAYLNSFSFPDNQMSQIAEYDYLVLDRLSEISNDFKANLNPEQILSNLFIADPTQRNLIV
jgi:serine/threonine protein kinase